MYLDDDGDRLMKPSDRSTTSRVSRLRRRAEKGQAVVIMALALSAVLAMVALVVDVGAGLLGQRRFDQNGADAAALALGRRFAANVALRNSTDVYFRISDADVYRLARHYAGLSPANWASASPTGVNQNAGLTQRNRLAVTVEYQGTAQYPTAWCYSPTGPQPPRNPAIPACTLLTNPNNANDPHPPLPSNQYPFRLRVTVSSSVAGFFSPAAGLTGQPSVPAQTDDTRAACLAPQIQSGSTWTALSGWTGNLTCAQAVVVVRGSGQPITLPNPRGVSAANCLVTGTIGQVVQLWGTTSGVNCGSYSLPSIPLPDLSDSSAWCDGNSTQGGDYYFGDVSLMPQTYSSGGCFTNPATSLVDDWGRGGGGFDADPLRTGFVDPTTDVPFWVANGFGGTVRPCSTVSGLDCTSNDGAKFPVYAYGCTGTSPTCSGGNNIPSGNLGSNIASGFYGSATPFFFQSDRISFPCSLEGDNYGALYGVGCRDAAVIVWTRPEWPAGSGSNWSWTTTQPNTNQLPGRVMAMGTFNFRFYCAGTASNCNQPPAAIPGAGGGQSSVFGVFLGALVPSTGCPTCNGPVSVFANSYSLE
jgi:hypothetical protein